ncbi:Acg family FMN-binding oxidoreductase [Nocardia carnea]|uniref:Acg family FMN-binding oxidoreductase n=1 Tax=Nocardia carnea TaxID=37328 RepID=UPI0024555523|nr:nitroreductase family protein [Nocardia carnea]
MNAGPSASTLEHAVGLAARAPSLHNSQPWQWRADGDVLRLSAARERMLPTTDPSGRQMLISCGATLDHLRAAMAAAGWRLSADRFPDPGDPELLAHITFEHAPTVVEDDRARADAIDRRYTDRLPFGPPPAWDEFEPALRSAVEDREIRVDVLAEDDHPALAHATQMTGARRRYDSAYHAELHWWTGHVIGGAGVPKTSLISPEEHERVDIGRRFPTVPTESDTAADTAEDHAVVLVLSTGADTRDDHVRCGEALSTVLLDATAAGYATCPLTHLTEISDGRTAIRELIGGDRLPQVLIRVGAPPRRDRPPARTPRLPLAEIFSASA